jgi:hypothetical protein
MSFDKASAVERLALTDEKQIRIAGGLIAAALAIAERFCDRKFDYVEDEVEDVIEVMSCLSLQHYPINKKMPVTIDATVISTGIQSSAGLIRTKWLCPGTVYEVQYSGGYKVLPADLEIALWGIFDHLWSTTPGAALASGSTAGAPIMRLSLPDAGLVQYFDRRDTSGFSGLIPEGSAALLETYKRRWA